MLRKAHTSLVNNLKIKSEVHYFYNVKMVGRGGLEPPTSRLSGVRSNHLSYRPQFDLAMPS